MKPENVITFENLPKAVSALFMELQDIKLLLTQKGEQPKNKTWLSLEELCDYLPEKPAKATVYAWVSEGKIPYHKKGKKLYFLTNQIEEFLKSGRKKTVSDIEKEAVAKMATAGRRAGK